MRVAFEVEQAGCESCGDLIRGALGGAGTVESVVIDEAADTAAIVLSEPLARAAVDAALEKASAGAGHAYRVRPGSWVELDEPHGGRG